MSVDRWMSTAAWLMCKSLQLCGSSCCKYKRIMNLMPSQRLKWEELQGPNCFGVVQEYKYNNSCLGVYAHQVCICAVYLNVLHELLDVSVSVWWHIAVGLHVEHRSQALPPQLVLLLQGHGHGRQQVLQRGQPLQGQRVVRLPAKRGSVVEQLDPWSMGEEVVIHGGLFMEQCPRLVTETRERRLVRPDVCSIKDDGCCPFVQLDLSRSNSRLLAE